MTPKLTPVTIHRKTIDEHAKHVERCYNSVQGAIFDFIDAIRDAQEDLGDALAQHEIGKRIGMHESIFSRWCSVAKSPLITNASKEELPSSMNALYQISRLEKMYLKEYDDGEVKLQKLCDRGKISSNSLEKQIKSLIDQLQKRLQKKQKRIREKKILSLTQGSLTSKPNQYSIEEAQKSSLRFRGFFIEPTDKLIRKWRDEFVTELDIGDEFPLHELRSPSMNQSNVALVKVSMKEIQVGLKILRSFGYSFRDVFIPNHGYEASVLMSKEDVVLRGERGKSQRLKSEYVETISHEDLTNWMIKNYDGPFASVFVESGNPDFSSITL